MSTVLTMYGSPSTPSRTDGVLSHVDRRLIAAGHRVQTLILRELPAGPLLAGDTTDPEIAEAVRLVAAADAVVIGSPVFKAAYSGLTKVFLDLLPQFAFRGKAVLPVVTGGTPAHVLAVDYALRPVLTSLGATHVGQGWFVLADHVQLYPDGGVLLDPVAAGPLFEVTDAFLQHLDTARRTATDGSSAPEDGTQIRVRRVRVGDRALEPLLADLVVEYGTRYGRPSANTQLTEVPTTDFEAPDGTFLVLTQDGETIAGGALRRKDQRTAEVKRVWTAHRHRRRGLARRVLTELELAALDLGYSQLYLTTGPRQPEARQLYLSAGYLPQFDLSADPESIGPLPFTKVLAGVPAQRVGGRSTLAGVRR